MSKDAFNIISGAINRRDGPLTLSESKLCSLLLYKMFKYKGDQPGSKLNVVDLPGVLGRRPIQVAYVSEIYEVPSETTKTVNRQTEVATAWLSELPADMQKKLASAWLDSAPDLAKDQVIKYWNKHHRASAKKTAFIISHIRMSIKMTERFVRAFAYYTGGLRPLAPLNDSKALKRKYVSETF